MKIVTIFLKSILQIFSRKSEIFQNTPKIGSKDIKNTLTNLQHFLELDVTSLHLTTFQKNCHNFYAQASLRPDVYKL